MKILKTSGVRLQIKDPVTGEMIELREGPGLIIGPVCQGDFRPGTRDSAELRELARSLIDVALGRGKKA